MRMGEPSREWIINPHCNEPNPLSRKSLPVGENANDSGLFARASGVKVGDVGVRHRRAHKGCPSLFRQHHIVGGETPLTGNEAAIFLADYGVTK